MESMGLVRPWGEVDEKTLGFGLIELTELCHSASEQRIAYLVNSYNDRSPSLSPAEKHFVAHYATRRGYKMVGQGDQAKFVKA